MPSFNYRAEGGGLLNLLHPGYLRRDDGGGLPDPDGLAGVKPSADTANPLVQGRVEQYANLPTERLEELAVRLTGSPQSTLVNRVLQQRRTQQTEAYKRGGGLPKRAAGGTFSPDLRGETADSRQAWRGAAANTNSGFLHGITPGRADNVQTSAPASSYVIPADVIAGLGEGNSLAGASRMDQVLGVGPRGIPLPRTTHARSLPHAPAPMQAAATGGPIKVFPELASGGNAPGATPVALSHGEYVVSPHDVGRIARGEVAPMRKHFHHIRKQFGHQEGSPPFGHRVLDRWVIHERKRQIRKLQGLPGPVKS